MPPMPEWIKSLRARLADTLNAKFSDANAITHCSVAFALDPRFRELHYVDENDREEIRSSIVESINGISLAKPAEVS